MSLYNETNLTAANNLYEIAKVMNDASSGNFILSLFLASVIGTYLLFDRTSNTVNDNLIITCFVNFILWVIPSMLGLIHPVYVIMLATFLFGSLIIRFVMKD